MISDITRLYKIALKNLIHSRFWRCWWKCRESTPSALGFRTWGGNSWNIPRKSCWCSMRNRCSWIATRTFPNHNMWFQWLFINEFPMNLNINVSPYLNINARWWKSLRGNALDGHRLFLACQGVFRMKRFIRIMHLSNVNKNSKSNPKSHKF